MKAVLRGYAMLLVVLIGVPGYAVERLVLYDDFNATRIDPDKWVGLEPSGAGTEAVRQIQGDQLRLAYRSYGTTDADRGGPRREYPLIFRNSPAVTAIQATVQVYDFEATGCPRNPQRTFTMAMLGGHFFSTATPTPDSAVSDVVALIGIVRASDSADPPDVLRARSLVLHCTDAGCMTGSALHSNDLGPVKRGEMAGLRVQWDRDTHRFIFQRNDDPEVIAPYTVSDTAPPRAPVKVLNAVHFVPNCTSTPRPVAFTEALFDDVLVNESAAEWSKNSNSPLH